MPKPPPKDVEIEPEGEDTQIFDSNKYPLLKRPGAPAAADRPPAKASAPARPTPGTRPPPVKEAAPLTPQPTRVVVMQVPPEAIPARPRDKRPSEPNVLPRDGGPARRKPPSNIAYPAGQGPDAGVPVGTPSQLARPVARPDAGTVVDTERVPRVDMPNGAPPTRATPNKLPHSAKTVIASADLDASVTSPDLKVPLDLRTALDSNPDLRATFDSSPSLPAIEVGPTNIVRVRQDSLGNDHHDTNPLAVPIEAMASHRSTAPMPIPEHTKIGVVERPAAPRPMSRAQAAVLAPPPVAAPHADPLAMVDAARGRRLPDRVRHVTPTALSALPDPHEVAKISSAAALAATVAAPRIRDEQIDAAEEDDDNFNETRERPIDRDALRKLPQAAALMALNDPAKKPPAKQDKAHPTPAVLMGPAQSRSLPVLSPADSGTSTSPDPKRPVAPARGGLVWVWMVLAALAIAAAVAAAMWYLAS